PTWRFAIKPHANRPSGKINHKPLRNGPAYVNRGTLTMFVRRTRAVRLVLAAALPLLDIAAPARAAEPEQAPIFVSGHEDYHTYPIPSFLVTQKGTLLAFCEGRKKSSSDNFRSRRARSLDRFPSPGHNWVR